VSAPPVLPSSLPFAAAAGALPLPIEFAVALLLVVGAVAFWMHRAYRRRTCELRESEERFRALFENAIEGVFETWPGGGFRRVNPAMARILGYATPEEVRRIPPERTCSLYASRTRRDEFFALLGASDRVLNFESEIRQPDGTTVWIEENVRAIRDAQGRLLYLQGFVSDITSRKRDEDALRASEERYRTLVEHSPIGMMEFANEGTLAWLARLRASGVSDFGAWCATHPDELRERMLDVKVVAANRAILRLLGAKDVGELIERFPEVLTPDALTVRQRAVALMWEQGVEFDGELTLRAFDGTLLPFYFHWWMPGGGGAPPTGRTQIALTNLADIRSTERALAAERERLSVTLRAMSEGVVTTDIAGKVEFMNEAAGVLTGWPLAVAVGQPLTTVCVFASEKAGQAVPSPIVAALSEDRAVDLPAHAVLQPRDGAARRIEGRCAPIHDAAGRAIGAVLVLRDMTERARLEAELLRASKLESIGVLAGGIAHDFNNLLAVVLGNLTLALLDEKTAASGERWLREAERGARRAKELTRQLLTFAKGGEPVRAAVSLAEVVREAAEFSLHGAAVRCEFELAADLRPADADKAQIGQVVQNLVINAVQAMPDGGVIRLGRRKATLADGAVHARPAGQYLRLEISDTGVGIAPQDLARIFEPFFTTKEHGTGLGLATVYSVIQKHRGHISVDSVVGRGTTFRAWLPAARLEPPPAIASTNPFEPMRGRVLFMDDEEPIRIMTKELLDRLGLETTLATDGGEAVREFALARVNGRRFDLVIMDLTVPGAMGGADAMREILKIDPEARGIVSSGYSSDPVMANYRAHGFRGMVPKPYRVSDFARTIREVLGGAAGGEKLRDGG